MIDKLIYLETEKEKYPMLFSFNVLEALQEEYGNYNDWLKMINGEKKQIDSKGKITWIQGECNLKALKFGLEQAINEGIDIENENLIEKRPFVDGKKVGRILTEIGVRGASEKLKEAVIESNNKKEETEIKN